MLLQTVRPGQHSPITFSRWSKIGRIDRPRQHPCKHRCDPIPSVNKQPAPSRQRSPTLLRTVRGSRHSPITVSRWSKIGRVDRSRKRVCKHLCDRIPQDRQTARAVAPSLSHALADCAPRPAQPHHRFPMVQNHHALAPCHKKRSRNPSQGRQTACALVRALYDTFTDFVRQPPHSRRRLSMVENLSHRPPAPSCVQAHRYDRIPKVGRRPAPSRRRSPTQFTVAECELPRPYSPDPWIVRSINARLGSSRDLKIEQQRRPSTPVREIMQ
jgi:hypothetical protein